jgi:class 3 adenylate cyclase
MYQFDDALVRTTLRQQVSRSIHLGGLVSLGFTVPLLFLLAGLDLLHEHAEYRLSLLAVGLGVVHSFAAYYTGRHHHATRRAVAMLLLPIIFIPAAFALGAHFLEAGGAASHVNGPISFVIIILVLITGFAFEAGISVAVGVCAAAGYLLMYLLASRQLGLLRSDAPAVALWHSNPTTYLIKASLIVVAGVIVAALSSTTRRLILRVSREEQEKAYIRRTFGMIVDPRVRDRMIDGSIELGGETRTATVLFADIRGFSTFSERMTPRELFLFMREYFDLLNVEIRKHSGTIIEYVGDEVMALFGAPLAMDDHAERALLAACDMQRALAAARPVWERTGKPAARAGVGVHTGPMLVGNIGSSDRYKYGALGDSVNLASRLQGLTKEHGVGIIASEETIQATANRFRVRTLGRVHVRGRESEVEIAEVLGPPGD